MLVQSVMNKKSSDVFSVLPDDTVLTVLQLFLAKKIGYAIVCDPENGIVGSVSERDICHAMSHSYSDGRQTAVKNIMTKNIVSCDIEDNLTKVRALMTGQKTRHLLVYKENVLIGIISIGDVVKHHLDETLHEEEAMRDYILGTGYAYSG